MVLAKETGYFFTDISMDHHPKTVSLQKSYKEKKTHEGQRYSIWGCTARYYASFLFACLR